MRVRFVKAAKTDVPASRSKVQLEDLLRRYGADGYSVAHNYGDSQVVVQFRVPDAPGDSRRVLVKLPIDIRQVHEALYGAPTGTDAQRQRQMEMAERVAWRNLILWVEAQLSAASIGLQTVTEAFYAHAVVGPAGERAIEYLPQLLDPSRMLGAGSR
jgi:hypothetical protein